MKKNRVNCRETETTMIRTKLKKDENQKAKQHYFYSC